ncbi:MAG: membrane protein insertase YidC [Proteobacteria bacterium]|nr:membrane protein insertase YidC [Pseudomonadota bacterium]
MEKRTIIALVLAVVIIFLFQTYFAPKPQQPPQQPTEQSQKKEQAKEGEKNKTQTIAKEEVQKGEIKQKGKGITSKPEIEAKPPKDIFVETPFFKVTLTDLGGGIKNVKLKQYKENVKDDKDKEMIEDVNPYVYLPAISRIVNNETINDKTSFKSDRDNVTIKDKPEKIIFTGVFSDGKKIKKTYTFYPDTYTIDMDVEVQDIDKNTIRIDFATINSKKTSSYTFKGPFVFNGKKFEQIEKIEKNIEIDKNFKYAGLDEGFFAFIYMPQDNSGVPLTILKTETGIPILRLQSNKENISAKLYFGPKQSDILKSLNVKAEKIIDFGWFDIIAKPLILGMNYSNKVTHNYGIDIILLTILIKIIFYPLSVKSFKSMNNMKKLQPRIQQLREKYKNDKQKLNQEMMDIYKREGVNPMGGCLPMVIQIPVFFALYKALSSAIELRHTPFMLWINDLSAPEDLYSFTVLGYSLPIRILPLIMGVTQVIQQKMTPTTADPMQEKMMLFMPILFTFLFWGFPAGLVLYWLVNNVISIGQQYYINKKVS